MTRYKGGAGSNAWKGHVSRWLVLIVGISICACARRNGTNNATGEAPVVGAHKAPAAAPAIDAGNAPAPSAPIASAVVPTGTKRSTVASGFGSGLRLDADTLIYCDKRGSRALDLIAGVERAHDGACPTLPEWRNRACGGIDFIEQVREPGVDDIIDTTEDLSLPISGHIHDCVFDSGVLLVGTGLEVVAFDVKAQRRIVKSRAAGDQVAITSKWLAWSNRENIVAERR